MSFRANVWDARYLTTSTPASNPSNNNFDKKQNTANFKKIRSQRFKAQDHKPKVQYPRCKAKDPKPKISSQSSHAKDPTPKTPSQRLEKLPPKMQHQGPQAKNPKPWIPRHATTPRKPTYGHAGYSNILYIQIKYIYTHIAIRA